eukprot:1159680-Pelagomonas_calceolata.AAC.4
MHMRCCQAPPGWHAAIACVAPTAQHPLRLTVHVRHVCARLQDRLLADKDELNRKWQEATQALKVRAVGGVLKVGRH